MSLKILRRLSAQLLLFSCQSLNVWLETDPLRRYGKRRGLGEIDRLKFKFIIKNEFEIINIKFDCNRK